MKNNVVFCPPCGENVGLPTKRGAYKGFTLIELLVVVLIIGILAAVAVPQYKKAVKKSRATEVDVIISALNKAIDAYLLENGFPEGNNYAYFTGKDSVSTIDLPGDCSKDDEFCYTDVGRVQAFCSSYCRARIFPAYNADGTANNTWLSSQSTALTMRKDALGEKWDLGVMTKINKNSTDAEDKQAGEVICPILEKYVAEDDAQFVAYCK